MFVYLLFGTTCITVRHKILFWRGRDFRSKYWFKRLVYFLMPINVICFYASSILNKWFTCCIETLVYCLSILSLRRIINFIDFKSCLILDDYLTWWLIVSPIPLNFLFYQQRSFHGVRLSGEINRLVRVFVGKLRQTCLTFSFQLYWLHLTYWDSICHCEIFRAHMELSFRWIGIVV